MLNGCSRITSQEAQSRGFLFIIINTPIDMDDLKYVAMSDGCTLKNLSTYIKALVLWSRGRVGESRWGGPRFDPHVRPTTLYHIPDGSM